MSTVSVYQLKISLRDIRPMIWRRVFVLEDTTLTRLHTVIQTAMGWEGYHLFDFAIRGETFGHGGASGSSNITLADCKLQTGESFFYIYDFGDDWVHEVKVEKLLEPKAKTFYPLCIDGKRACPPEDSGGPWGYRDLLKVLKNKRHPDYRELRGWVGRSFDPEAFDVEDVNTRLKVLGVTKSYPKFSQSA
jgi:integrase/recombinase XerD